MVQTLDPGSERVLSFSARTKLDMIRRILSFLHWHIMKEKKDKKNKSQNRVTIQMLEVSVSGSENF